jgi:hypothetical protein
MAGKDINDAPAVAPMAKAATMATKLFVVYIFNNVKKMTG